MKYLIATCGSLGDVAPMLALALALQERGHDVVLAAPPNNRALVEGRGLSFRPLGTDMRELVGKVGAVHRYRSVPMMARVMSEEWNSQWRELLEPAAEAEAIIGASLLTTGPTVAEYVGRPYIWSAFCPQVLPSAQHAPPLIQRQNLPRAVNRSAWRGMKVDVFGHRRLINRIRARLGLPPVRDLWGHMIGDPVLLACDPALAPKPADAPVEVVQTGYWHLRDEADLPPEVEAFLAAGPPPIYVGFGSMPALDADRVGRMVTAAGRRAGRRLIVSRGWSNVGDGLAGDDLLVVGPTPHHKLFPRLAAAVHHGGSGTTASAAAAGIPQVIAPHTLDQYYWADRVVKAGLGPPAVPKSRFNVDRLAAAMTAAAENPAYRAAARRLADELARQDPLGQAVGFLESRLVSQAPTGPG